MSYSDRENDTPNALYEVSMRGSVSELDTLIGRDPLILHKLSLTTFTETPLHISSLLGHLDFTKSLLTHKPQLALELDLSKRTPLHLASAQGHVEIVHELLQTYEDACLISDQDGRIPLHYAATRGRTEIAAELIGAKPESLMVLDESGKTVLHLCVEHNHLETLKTLVQVGGLSDDGFLNKSDLFGNTILHLAVNFKQVESIRYLLSISKIREEANLENKMGRTALDMLVDAGIMNNNGHNQTHSLQSTTTVNPPIEKYWTKFFGVSKRSLQDQGDRLEHMRGMLSVVATMISSMTFNALMNPPGGVIQANSSADIHECHNHNNYPCPGEAVMSTYEGFYSDFMLFNSICFVTSLSITLLLVSGVPLKNEVVMGILSISTCVTLTFLVLSYCYAGFVLNLFFPLPSGIMFLFWLPFAGLMAVIMVIRVIYWLKVMKHRAELSN